MSTVSLYALTPLGAPIENAVLRVLSVAGALVTEVTTDVSGKAGPIALPDASYLVAPYKQGVVWSPVPWSLVVSADAEFDITGEVVSLPTATDALRCRVWGILRDPFGTPVKGVRLVFRAMDDSILAGGDMIIKDGHTESDQKTGAVDVELYRGLTYMIYVPTLLYDKDWQGTTDLEDGGFSAKIREVPDQASVSLGNLLLPRPARILFSVPAVSVGVGVTDCSTSLIVRQTNTIDSQTAENESITYASSDVAVATVIVQSNGTIQIIGVSQGTATITATRNNYPPAVSPSDAITVDTFTITVV